MVFRVGLLDSSDAGDIGWSRVPLAELHGAATAEALETAGVETVLGSPVSAIERSTAGAFTVSSGTRSEVVDAVVVATPLRVSAVLGAFDRTADLERLGASPIVNVHLVLDRKVTDLAFAACVGSPVQFVFDRTASSGVRSGQCLSISLSAADSYIGQGSSELVRVFLEAVRDLFPPARRARLVDALVTRERAATFRAVPGTRALRPGTRTAVRGLVPRRGHLRHGLAGDDGGGGALRAAGGLAGAGARRRRPCARSIASWKGQRRDRRLHPGETREPRSWPPNPWRGRRRSSAPRSTRPSAGSVPT